MNLPTNLILFPRGCAQVEADRKRLDITPEMLERRRRESLLKPF